VKRVTALGFLACAVACTSRPSQRAFETDAGSPSVAKQVGTKERASLGSVLLELSDCELAYQSPSQNGTVSLGLGPTCHFIQNRDGGVKVVAVEKGAGILAVGSTELPGEPSRGKDCDTRLRAILINDAGVSLSKETGRASLCFPREWDEKAFHIMLQETVLP